MSADEKDAAVVRLQGRTDPAAAAEEEEEEEEEVEEVAECVGEPIAAAVKSEPGTNSAAAAEPESEPCSSVVKPLGEAWVEAAV